MYALDNYMYTVQKWHYMYTVKFSYNCSNKAPVLFNFVSSFKEIYRVQDKEQLVNCNK